MHQIFQQELPLEQVQLQILLLACSLIVFVILVVFVMSVVFEVLLHWLRRFPHFSRRCSTSRFGSWNVRCGYDGGERNCDNYSDDGGQNLLHGGLLPVAFDMYKQDIALLVPKARMP